MAFKIGEAFVEVGLKDPTAADEEATRRRIEEGLGRRPPRVPVQIQDPVNAAFKAKLDADLRAVARELTAIPVEADTEGFRREVAEQIRGVEELLSVDIPMDVADAAKWRARVMAEAAAISKSVKARIPVEVDEPTVKQAEGRLKRFALGAAAVVGPPGAVGAALLGTTALVGGLGIAAAKGDKDVSAAFGHLSDKVVSDVQDMARAVVPSLLTVERSAEQTFSRLEPTIGRAVAAVAPEIESLANGVLGFAEHALPGMVASLQRSAPVVDAFSHGFVLLGDGVSGFLEGLSTGAPGAAAGLDSLLGGVAAVLPPLGHLIGSVSNVERAEALPDTENRLPRSTGDRGDALP